MDDWEHFAHGGQREAIETEMSALLAKGLGGMSQVERDRHEQLKQALQQLKAQPG